MQNYPTKKRFAFTLIELVGVIAIIAILLALLIPRIVEVIRDSAVTQTITSINSIRTGAAAYLSKNGSFPATGTVNFDQTLASGSFIDKVFTSKLTATADIEIVVGEPTTATAKGYWNLANASPVASVMKASDSVIIANLPGVSPRDADKLNELIDGDTSASASNGQTENVGKVRIVTTGATVNVYVYITH